MTSETENDAASHSQSPDDNDSGDQDAGEMVENRAMEGKNGEQKKDGSEQKKTSSNSKDPSRPRRKKARRACYACQRAHLTCGDERPCQRCIKRGLQDACQDGVRKKAKYLHDAPNEALLPGVTNHYQYIDNLRRTPQNPQSPTYPLTSTNEIFGQRQGPSFPVYGPSITSTPLSMPENLMTSQSCVKQQSPIAAQFPVSSGQIPTSMQSLVQAMESSAPPDSNTIQGFGGNLFDGNDLTQYNFDPASFNFGNHYGALEFGMLNHISSGAAETPPSDSQSLGQNGAGAFPTPGTINTTFSESPGTTQPYLFNQDPGWRTPTQPQSNVRQSGVSSAFIGNGTMKQEGPNAFPIGDAPAFASPTSERSPQVRTRYEDNSAAKPMFTNSSAPDSRPGTQGRWAQTQSQQAPQASQGQVLGPSRRRGDPSAIYENVTQPYSYTSGFHSLIAFLQKRFSSQSTLRIAKALASIRPSFLSCTKTLGREDLVFMEKCFQRTLWEYEDFINACGTPTIVCRRTGEVAAVGKEFSILTGWKKPVLLGHEANLNVNTGGSTGNASTAPSSRGGGMSTPRIPEGALDSSRPQPVFLAELLDDDSVIEFYEDFARLAFGDSRGGVTTRCKLLKYRSKEEEGMEEVCEDGRTTGVKRKRGNVNVPGGGTAGQARIDELGDRDGKVECSCCWTVKRDLFDLPMMIVMNFLPCI